MKKLNLQRFALALASLAGIVAIGVGIFVVLGLKIEITTFAASAIVLLIRELGGGKAVAFSWFFDGSADKPPPEPGTSTTTASAMVEPVKSNALAGATPTGKPGDPVAVTEVPPATT